MLWLLSFIPYYVYGILMIASLVFYFFFSQIKFDYGLNIHSKVLKIFSLIFFCFSTFMFGFTYSEKLLKEKIEDMEEKVRISEQKSKDTNVVIQEKIIYKDKIIKEKADEIVKYIDRYTDREIIKTLPPEEQVRYKEIIKYVENCPVPKEFVNIHNKATKMIEGDKK